MAYNSQITRTDAGALIPEEVQREIVQNLGQSSAFLRLARRLPNMSRKQLRIPVLSALPTAYFVTGDTGLKQTTEMAWANKYINAEEIAVIVPIPKVVLDDTDYDMWSEIRPSLDDAIGAVIDAAVIHGTNAPSTWPSSLVAGSLAAGNTESLAAHLDAYDAVLGDSGTMSNVEADGYMVTGHLAHLTMKSKLRGLRDANGAPIFMTSLQQATNYALDGQKLEFAENGAMDPALALLVSGDFRQAVYSIRQDIESTLATEATITDQAGNVVYNLFQQDMVAIRLTIRLGWQIPNPINRTQTTEASRFPFGVLTP